MRTAITALVAALTLGIVYAADDPVGAAQGEQAGGERPRVEVVFVLDTTGSMSGLINAAKEKIWAIANTLASADPAPEIRMGLVGYRDRGDDYVTKLTDLTDDLDAVYADLMGFEANGGGDGPESVNQALHEAVANITWSDNPKAYKVIFLVGDYPPHMDYDNDVRYPESCKTAATKGICINAIQCGDHGPTTPIWQDIAGRADGAYFRVEQSGGAILAATPYDAELAELARKLEGTRIFYGDAKELAAEEMRRGAADAIHAGATVEAKARRATFMASEVAAKAPGARRDLVYALDADDVEFDKIEKEELPAELRGLSTEELEAHVKKVAAERKAIEEKIKDLAGKRQAHLVEQLKAQELKGEGSLDFALYECISTQAAEKGIEYEDGPAL